MKKKSFLFSVVILLSMAFTPLASAGSHPELGQGDGGGGIKKPVPICDNKGNCMLP
ncbi:hypothetical protein [Sporosarcina limicola]|uniref:Secreted protein n=1 Tax=Sporosarcina limicola TaxID=34101 RepID=A0A927RBE6_9BACL|nr:hypothetical protein [Sporosarcina limicola]MBE1553305.1 hypothetical protein [Sporosarcina limicola]